MADDLSESEGAYYQARSLFAAGDIAGCVTVLERTLAGQEGHFKSYELLGRCRLRLGHPQDAVTALRRAVALNGRSCKTLTLLAQTLAGLGASTEAREIIARVLGISPTYGPAKALRRSLGG